jgi:hypothetical protein
MRARNDLEDAAGVSLQKELEPEECACVSMNGTRLSRRA